MDLRSSLVSCHMVQQWLMGLCSLVTGFSWRERRCWPRRSHWSDRTQWPPRTTWPCWRKRRPREYFHRTMSQEPGFHFYAVKFDDNVTLLMMTVMCLGRERSHWSCWPRWHPRSCWSSWSCRSSGSPRRGRRQGGVKMFSCRNPWFNISPICNQKLLPNKIRTMCCSFTTKRKIQWLHQRILKMCLELWRCYISAVIANFLTLSIPQMS